MFQQVLSESGARLIVLLRFDHFFKRRRRLTEIYGRRNLYPYFERETLKLRDELENQPYRDAEYYFENFRLMNDLFFHANTVKDSKSALYLEESIENLNYYSAIERLRLGCEMKSREGIFSKKYDLKTANQDFFKDEENALFRMFSKVIELGDSKSDSIFFELKEDFIKNVKTIKDEDGQRVLLSLLNFAIRQTASDEATFLKEVFILYKIGLNNQLLVKENQITSYTFLNIVITGSKLQEFDWVQSFISKYQLNLKPKFLEDTVALGLGFLNFHKEDYEEVITILRFHDFNEILPQINAKTLLLRSYFELLQTDSNYLELVISVIESFEKFIRRKGFLNDRRREIYLNFIVILKKLVKHSTDIQTENIETKKKELLKTLENYKSIFAGTWLKEKILNLK